MAIGKALRQKVYQKCGGRCGYCGESIKENGFQVDHIISQRNFLTHIVNKWQVPDYLLHLTTDDVNHIDNLMPACRVCNNWKSTNPIEFFRSEIQDQIKRVNSYSSNYRMAKRYGLVEETPKPIVFYFETITVNQPTND
ncbi:HNH endonuclease [Spirosoma sordidisoli]|nr:HNH endonuclease signature motif containing protein [Spirosoma sordidisoli]